MGGRAALTKNRADETDRLELRPQWADGEEGIDGSALTFLVDRANAFSMTSAFSSIMDGIAATATDNISLMALTKSFTIHYGLVAGTHENTEENSHHRNMNRARGRRTQDWRDPARGLRLATAASAWRERAR